MGADQKHQQHPVTASLVYGRNLAARDLHIINSYRDLEFGSKDIIKPEPENEDWNKPYFLVRDGEELVAFGRLHMVRVELEAVPSTILGIASIVAVKKGAGYGKALMERIKAYVEESGLSAVGFCKPAVSGFYEKCGYGILKNGLQRFVFLDAKNHITAPDHEYCDVLYISGEDQLIEALKSAQEARITAFRTLW